MADSHGHTDGVTNHPLANDNLPQTMAIAAFTAIAWYNVIELNISIYLTFKRKRGLYFWCLVISSWGIVFHSLGFLLKLFGVVKSYQVTCTMITIGWYAMVTGQSLVLYSRLHLVVKEDRILRWVLIMIIWNAITLHIPTTVLTYGSNSPQHELFSRGYAIMEKIQMTMFCLQEFIISGIYVWATLRLLKPVYKKRTQSVMTQLLWINVGIIMLDIAMLVMEYLQQYAMETVMKGFVYSVKLKLEFAVLNQLMRLANSSRDTAIFSADDDQKPNSSTKPHQHGFGGFVRRILPGRNAFHDEANSIASPTLEQGSGIGLGDISRHRSVAEAYSFGSSAGPAHLKNMSAMDLNRAGNGITLTTEITQTTSLREQAWRKASADRRRSSAAHHEFQQPVQTSECNFYNNPAAFFPPKKSPPRDPLTIDESDDEELEPIPESDPHGLFAYTASSLAGRPMVDCNGRPAPPALSAMTGTTAATSLPSLDDQSIGPTDIPELPAPAFLLSSRPSVTDWGRYNEPRDSTSSEANLRSEQ